MKVFIILFFITTALTIIQSKSEPHKLMSDAEKAANSITKEQNKLYDALMDSHIFSNGYFKVYTQYSQMSR